jgi:hypothetical protein
MFLDVLITIKPMGLKIPKEKLECKAKARKRVSSQNESEK